MRRSVNAGKTFFSGAARLLLQSSLISLCVLAWWLFYFLLFVFFLMQRETAVAVGALPVCIVHNSSLEPMSQHGLWFIFVLREVDFFFC